MSLEWSCYSLIPGGELSGLPLSMLGVVTLYIVASCMVPGCKQSDAHSSRRSSIPSKIYRGFVMWKNRLLDMNHVMEFLKRIFHKSSFIWDESGILSNGGDIKRLPKIRVSLTFVRGRHLWSPAVFLTEKESCCLNFLLSILPKSCDEWLLPRKLHQNLRTSFFLFGR